MGLDKDDEIVKRRMAQKMHFLAEDVAAAREPTTAELEAWFEERSGLFALPSRVSFRHLYFAPDRRGDRARADAERALARLAGQPEDAAITASLADPFMFQDYYRDRAPEFLGKEFGPGFAEAVAKLAPGSWQGPIESGFGWHLVFVDTVVPGRIPAYEEIEGEVRTARPAPSARRARRSGPPPRSPRTRGCGRARRCRRRRGASRSRTPSAPATSPPGASRPPGRSSGRTPCRGSQARGRGSSPGT